VRHQNEAWREEWVVVLQQQRVVAMRATWMPMVSSLSWLPRLHNWDERLYSGARIYVSVLFNITQGTSFET